MAEINPDTHIYLYAKNWYKQTNYIDDMKILLYHRSDINPLWISQADIVNVLSKIVFPYLYSDYELRNFINDMIWVQADQSEDIDRLSLFIQAVLIILARTPVIGLDLGEPDYRILPKREK